MAVGYQATHTGREHTFSELHVVNPLFGGLGLFLQAETLLIFRWGF